MGLLPILQPRGSSRGEGGLEGVCSRICFLLFSFCVRALTWRQVTKTPHENIIPVSHLWLVFPMPQRERIHLGPFFLSHLSHLLTSLHSLLFSPLNRKQVSGSKPFTDFSPEVNTVFYFHCLCSQSCFLSMASEMDFYLQPQSKACFYFLF